MVDIIGIIKPVIYGVVSLSTLIAVFYFVYLGLKQIGIIKDTIFSKRGKVSEEVLVDATQQIVNDKTFMEYATYISKFPKPKQEQYLRAYYKVIEVKGGENDG